TEDASIYYTWDGSMPTTNSYKYTEPILVPEGNNVLSVIVVDKHGMTSNVVKGNYIYLP
nr:chitobiase/beta-hexosaminidase C-terminal domain-containing protein [Lachnospiraceae bacterium]